MVELQGILICVPLYTFGVLVLGASITAGLFVFHVAVVPLIFKYSKTFRRSLIFANFVQWPLYIDYEEPSSSGIEGGRNLSIQYHSKIDNCTIKIGIWHILPKSVYERLKGSFEGDADKEELSKILDEELANSKTPIMMYCHGNSNSRAASHRIQLYKFFQQMDFHTIAFDYRGYGDSTNLSPSEDGVVEDSLVVYEWLHNQVDNGKDKPAIFVWGHSLGTGISSHLLGNLEKLSVKVLDRGKPLPMPNGLILEAPFNNLADEVAKHPLSKLVAWLPYYESTFVSPFRSAPEHSFRSDEHLSRVRSLPVLILHAKDDVIVPFVVGVKLYKSIVDSRSAGGATIKLHAYDKEQNLGHKWICNANDLPHVVGWLKFGGHVTLTVLFLHTVVFPLLFIFSRKVRSECLFAPSIAWPFVNHDDPKLHGLDGARNVSINFESTYDKCTINLGVWHVLPKSLVKKHKFLLNAGSKDELNKLFDEEMKNSEYPIFLYFHGMIGSRASNYRLELYKFLQNLDAHVVTFDYRGFGDSSKVPPTKIGTVEDGLIVYSWIRRLVGSEKPVYIWGHSIGSGICQRAFSKLNPYSDTLLGLKDPLPPPQGIILEGGYNSNIELSKDFIVAQFANWAPHLKAIVVNTLRGTEVRIVPEDYASRLKQYPMLIMHAKNDGVIPYQYGKTLYEKHREVRKEGDAPLTFKTFEIEGHFYICTDASLPGIIEDFIQSCRT